MARGKWKRVETRFFCVCHLIFNTTHDTLQARSTTRLEHLPSPPCPPCPSFPPDIPYGICFYLSRELIKNSLPLCDTARYRRHIHGSGERSKSAVKGSRSITGVAGRGCVRRLSESNRNMFKPWASLMSAAQNLPLCILFTTAL